MCNCKTMMEEKLLEKLKNDKPDAAEPTVELRGYGLMFSKDGEMSLRPVTPVEFRYLHTFKNGKTKIKRETISLALNNCPFCGKPVMED